MHAPETPAAAAPRARDDVPAAGANAASALVVQTSFVGDVILTTPLIAALSARGPVDVVVTPAGATVLANNPAIRRVIVYDKRGRDRGLAGLRRVARAARVARRDVNGGGTDGGGTTAAATTAATVATGAPPGGPMQLARACPAYLAQGSLRSAAVAILAGRRERVGFDSSPARFLYTVRVPYRRDVHHAERLWRLAFAAGNGPAPSPERLRPRLYPSDDERAEAARLLAAAPAHRPIVALAPGSAWSTKRWPYFPELARQLSAWATIVIVGGSEDREAARAITAAVASVNAAASARAHAPEDALGAGPDAVVVDTAGQLSLLASAAVIAHAALLVTNDSAPQHLASAMGTPTIALFGPTTPAFGFGPLAPRSLAMGVDELSCRPCHHHGPRRCPLGHWRCLRDLDAARVAAVATSIARSP